MNVVVASSDRLFADVVAQLIDGRDGWRCVAVAADGIGALGAVGRHRPSALLILGELPRLGAGAVAEQIHRRWPDVEVVTIGSAESTAAVALPPDVVTDGVFAALLAQERSPRERATAEAGWAVARLATLTPRERTVLILMARGLPMPAIAEEMGLSANTIRTHMQNLYAKLDCHTQLEVVTFAVRQGLVSATDAPSD